MTSPLMQTSPIVIEQRRKLFEMRNQYRVFDQHGSEVGAVEQVSQSALTFLARLGTDLDVVLPVTLTVTDASGQETLVLDKPWFRMTLSVTRPDESAVGTIAKRIKLGKARFTLADSTGGEVGEVRAENWRARDFAIVDQSGNEVARATKKWRGVATEMFTDADTYVVNLDKQLSDPLRSLALAASLAIDLVMKQKD